MASPLDKSQFIHTFKAEADEQLATLNQRLVSLEKHPRQPEALAECQRATHTLKGSARMMGYSEIEAIAHRLEDLFALISQGALPLTSPLATQMFHALDTIHMVLERIVQGQSVSVDVSVVCHVLEEILTHRPRDTEDVGGRGPDTIPPLAQDLPPPPTSDREPRVPPGVLDGSIRIPLSRADALLNLAGELVVHAEKSSEKRARFRQVTELVRSLREQLAKVAQSVGDGLPAHHPGDHVMNGLQQCAHDVEELRQQVLALSDRILSEGEQLDPVVDELQFKVKQLRMLPCATVCEGFARLVRDVATTEHKTVEFVINGEETELDKAVLDAIKPCLIHLLRNAVSHGIATPAERLAQGKPTHGTVRLEIRQQGSKVIIDMRDDGMGIDGSRVKAVALQKGLVTEAQLARMEPRDVLNLVFAPGFSTAAVITEVSGRGLGLDVVRREVDRLKGQVTIRSQVGEGTTVTIELPLTIAVIPVLVVETAGYRSAFPLPTVEELLTIQPAKVQTLQQRPAVTVRERIIPLAHLAEVLQLVRAEPDELPRPREAEAWPVVMVNVLDQRMGFHVDRIIGEEQVFIRDLGPHLGRVRLLGGAAVLGGGEVMPVLDVGSLIQAAQGAQPVLRPGGLATRAKHRILVVEDSLTTRELERSILEGHGYLVETAIDGLDGLEKLSRSPFHLVVCDIQMPRMDGFELCRAIRQQAAYKDLPLIFVTVKEREEEKRRGIEVGAQAYVLKRAFDQSALLQTIERLVG